MSSKAVIQQPMHSFGTEEEVTLQVSAQFLTACER